MFFKISNKFKSNKTNKENFMKKLLFSLVAFLFFQQSCSSDCKLPVSSDCKLPPSYYFEDDSSRKRAIYIQGYKKPKSKGPYKCLFTNENLQECPYESKTKPALRIHENKQHLRIEFYSCSKCESSFVSSYILLCHRKECDPEAFFPCVDCEKLFVRKERLILHYKNCHPLVS